MVTRYKPQPSAMSAAPVASDRVLIASHLLAILACGAVMVYAMLPGLLAICVGFLLTSTLTALDQPRRVRINHPVAVAIVIALPILGIAVLLANVRGMAFSAVTQYQALLQHLAATVLEIRQKLPPDLAANLPDELIPAQKWLVDYLQSQARALTGFGTAGLRGSLLVYVGLIIGALMAGQPRTNSQGPLRAALRERGRNFMRSFRQIVVAQFWIALFNAACTGVFLFVALPMAGVTMPYGASLVLLTFFAGLIPIVGNLLCNGVMTIAGVSVSPTVGLACLLFLVAIHKFEYFVNARVVGQRTNTSAWELLTVMFLGEAVFGVAGLVAAPLFYAYAKSELAQARLI
jgi:predicted PurR-regulated permease PerM